MLRSIAALLLVLAAPAFSAGLDVYVVDVEGGNATLFVWPSHESLLIDTGNAGAAAPRDAGRILEAAKDAGLTQIEHLITTHWHGDHFGGMAELAARIPIREFIDHGPTTNRGNSPTIFCAPPIRSSTHRPGTPWPSRAIRSRLPAGMCAWLRPRAKSSGPLCQAAGCQTHTARVSRPGITMRKIRSPWA